MINNVTDKAVLNVLACLAGDGSGHICCIQQKFCESSSDSMEQFAC